jgi:hypothetical protein
MEWMDGCFFVSTQNTFFFLFWTVLSTSFLCCTRTRSLSLLSLRARAARPPPPPAPLPPPGAGHGHSHHPHPPPSPAPAPPRPGRLARRACASGRPRALPGRPRRRRDRPGGGSGAWRRPRRRRRPRPATTGGAGTRPRARDRRLPAATMTTTTMTMHVSRRASPRRSGRRRRRRPVVCFVEGNGRDGGRVVGHAAAPARTTPPRSVNSSDSRWPRLPGTSSVGSLGLRQRMGFEDRTRGAGLVVRK